MVSMGVDYFGEIEEKSLTIGQFFGYHKRIVKILNKK